MLRTFPLSPAPTLLLRLRTFPSFPIPSRRSRTFSMSPRTSIIPPVHSVSARPHYAFAGLHYSPYCPRSTAAGLVIIIPLYPPHLTHPSLLLSHSVILPICP